MKYRILGRTGLKVSVIGLGTHQFSGEWAREFSAVDVQGLLERARENGINFLDTAECYGNHSVEALVGQAIQSNRNDWIVATKFGHEYITPPTKTDSWSAADVRRQLEDSLRALRTDYVDIYQFHSGTNEAFQNDSLWTMLTEQVRAGRIRHLGISLSAALLQKEDFRQLEGAQKAGISVIQVLYNRLFPAAEKNVLPFCEKHNLGVLARVPLAKGFLSGRYKPGASFAPNDIRSTYDSAFNDEQLRAAQTIQRDEVPPGQNMAQWALAWCLRNPAVHSVIVGSKSLAQLESNAAAAALLAEPGR